VALLDVVEAGTAARRVEDLAVAVSDGDGLRVPVADAIAAAQSTATLARSVQQPIVRDIASRAAARAAGAQVAAGTLIGLALLLLVCVVWLGIAVSRSVSLPLRRLTSAATVVADLASKELFRVADTDADDSRPPKLAAVDVRTSDEIGELAVAFNRVQTTAALLMEQQVANRRNVSVMFANIARRTRSLVARQLTFIDDFERNEQDERMLTRLYRLDHLTTRLRRSADSLLVVSGIREDERLSAEAPLLEVVRSAIAEIEGYQAIRIAAICEVTVLPQLVPDLRLLLAELLENATAFSPPGTPVEVYARLSGDCRITIVDHGIGMSDGRLDDENRRLVERERLDVAPTSALGLFVVGRLARRHGLRVALRPSPGQGVSVEVRVPPAQFTTGRVLSRHLPPPAVEGPRRSGPAQPRLANWPAMPRDEAFAWFEAQDLIEGTAPRALPAGPAPAALPPGGPPTPTRDGPPTRSPAGPPAPTRDGLARREPGGHLPAFDLDPAEGGRAAGGRAVPGGPGVRGGFVSPGGPDDRDGFGDPGGAAARGGLTRREPGTHLDRSLHADGEPSPTATHGAQLRDPDAERAELDSFIAGVARAVAAPTDAATNQ
jgi:signal transduction histidine kinase